MKNLLVLPCLLLLIGCSTAAPVTAKFPTVPDIIKEDCDRLNLVKETSTLSDVMITITQNYIKYHDCARKNQAWKEWYDQQKRIFEDATANK